MWQLFKLMLFWLWKKFILENSEKIDKWIISISHWVKKLISLVDNCEKKVLRLRHLNSSFFYFLFFFEKFGDFILCNQTIMQFVFRPCHLITLLNILGNFTIFKSFHFFSLNHLDKNTKNDHSATCEHTQAKLAVIFVFW